MPSPTPESPPVALATLGIVTGANDETSDSIEVHFNPASLQLQLSNELKNTDKDERKQYVANTSAKLTMDLVFDTTDNGEDVTQTTRKLQGFISPKLPEGEKARKQIPPPLVLFEWGTLKFKGIAESYKETIDYFSANGVPLRSSINLTLSRQEQVFDEASKNAPKSAGEVDAGLFDAVAPSAAKAANDGNDPAAARALASANNQENLRFGDGTPLTVNAKAQLKPPTAFASGGGGFGGGFGISGGISGGFDLSTAAEAEISAGGGISGLARLSASEGCFAGLRPPAVQTSTVRLDARKMMPRVASGDTSTGPEAMFQAGGRARTKGPAGLSAEVGSSARLSFNKE